MEMTPYEASIMLRAAAFGIERKTKFDDKIYTSLIMGADSLEKQYDLNDIISIERMEE